MLQRYMNSSFSMDLYQGHWEGLCFYRVLYNWKRLAGTCEFIMIPKLSQWKGGEWKQSLFFAITTAEIGLPKANLRMYEK